VGRLPNSGDRSRRREQEHVVDEGDRDDGEQHVDPEYREIDELVDGRRAGERLCPDENEPVEIESKKRQKEDRRSEHRTAVGGDPTPPDGADAVGDGPECGEADEDVQVWRRDHDGVDPREGSGRDDPPDSAEDQRERDDGECGRQLPDPVTGTRLHIYP